MLCERCGQDFGCGSQNPSQKCWCANLPMATNLPMQYNNCLCPQCLSYFIKGDFSDAPDGLIEGEDFYYDKKSVVFTKYYHTKKGYCCKNNCRHCPY